MEFYISIIFHYLYYIADLKDEINITMNGIDPFGTIHSYASTGFTLPNFTIKILMESMEVEQIMNIIRFLLLERKILIVRNRCEDNAILMESILMLLSPL